MFSAFDCDLQLMFSNCFTYNAPSSVAHKLAVEIKSSWDVEKLLFIKRLYGQSSIRPTNEIVPDADTSTSSSLKPPGEVKQVDSPRSALKTLHNRFALSTDIPIESGLRLRWALCLFQEKQFLPLLTERFSEILNNLLLRSIDSTEVFRVFDATNLRLIFQIIRIVWQNSSGTLPVDEGFYRVILPRLLAELIEKTNVDEFDIAQHLKLLNENQDLSPHQSGFLEFLVSRLHSAIRKISLSKK